MLGKLLAFSWSILHSIGDTLEEKILIKYNDYQYMFFINLFGGFFSLIAILLFGIKLTFLSFIVLIFYALSVIGGDFCYVKAISHVPLGLANLVDSGVLFIILICDICLGYVKPNLIFLILFLIFFISVYIFSSETNKMKQDITVKKIDLKYIFVLITATIFYASEPYFLKLAGSKGANEPAEILMFYTTAITVFYFLYKKHKKDIKKLTKQDNKIFFKEIIILSMIYTTTRLLAMFAYASGTPSVIAIILKLQLFFIVIISVIRKTDKMNLKKTIALILGFVSILIMTLMS